jgi:phosphohistidine phosphatase SixA
MADKPRGTALTLHSQAIRAIATIEGIANYYGEKISQRGDGFEIGDVMKIIGAEVERGGIHIELPREPDAPP